MTLWLVRHAKPLIAAGVCYGVHDVPAEPEATLECAQRLAAALPQGAQLRTSLLQRCELLTNFLCGLRPDLTPIRDPRLVEMNFGSFEGMAWSDIPKAALDAWTADFAHHRFGGQESVAEFMARVGAAWDECQAQSTTYPHQVWITHAGVARAATLLSQGIRVPKSARQWPADAPGFGEWIQRPLDYSPFPTQ